MMPSEDSLRDSGAESRGAPAWPLLAGIQLGILLAILGAGWSSLPARPAPLPERLAALDPDTAAAAVQAARARADTGRALSPAAEARTLQFLTLQARAAGMDVQSSRLRPGIAQDGVQPVDMVLTVVGDPYHLPIFLDGLHRQRAINHPLSVRGSGAGGRTEFAVTVRFYRPVVPEGGWVAPRLSAAAPAHAAQAPLLEAGLELAAWRRFQAAEGALARARRGGAPVRRSLGHPGSDPHAPLRRGGGVAHLGLRWSLRDRDPVVCSFLSLLGRDPRSSFQPPVVGSLSLRGQDLSSVLPLFPVGPD